MKLVKQTILYFSEGKSDKVYEVDLYESNPDLFIVNFRYGRRGANLREGTKTVFPVTYDEAEVIFNKLVDSKVKKGYSENASQSGSPVPGTVNIEKENVARRDTILKYLQQAKNGSYIRDWKISRVLWRAAELNIKEAAPLASHFIKSTDAFEQYAAIYALITFKDSNYIENVFSIFLQEGFGAKVGRIAATYILYQANKTEKHKITEKALANLPEAIKLEKETFLSSLSMYYVRESDIDPMALFYAYIASYNDAHLSKELVTFLKQVPIKKDTFKSLRYIYRVSSLLGDIPVFALLSKRIALSKPGYASYYTYVNNEWVSTDIEKKKKNPSIAFSGKTKQYFNKITYQNVQKLSRTNEDAYVEYVTYVLISLDDTIDNQKPSIQYSYIYNDGSGQWEHTQKHYPKYTDFTALMFILYGNTDRLQRQKNRWYGTENISASLLPREEILPELWNNRPDDVFFILANSKSEEAVYFAMRIVKDNAHFLKSIPPKYISLLVGHYNPEVVEMIATALKSNYANVMPQKELILSLLKSNSEDAIALGLQWLELYKEHYFTDESFLVSLIKSENFNVINYLNSLYRSNIAFNIPINFVTISDLFKDNNTFQFEYLVEVSTLIGDTYFGKLINDVSQENIIELSQSSVISNRLFAINFAKHHSTGAYNLFKDSIDGYITNEHSEVRKAGIELLSHFPEAYLIENNKRIIRYCFSSYPEVREAIQPTVKRLTGINSEFKQSLLRQLLKVIIEKETYEGMHRTSYDLITGNYDKSLSAIQEEDIFNLVLSDYEFAQKIGTPIFKKRIHKNNVSVSTLVTLANSPVLEIRNEIKDYFDSNTSRVNYELESALHIFSVDWDDIIDWAIEYFEKNINASNWTIDLLLYVCDHTKDKVQSFGRKMITTHFTAENGLPLLLKLQEHPTSEMQFFVTNYLENYASDNEDVILSLKDYFKTTLFAINKNRATKTRVYKFLEEESIKNSTVATMVVDIISSVLGTQTMTDMTHNIDILLAINTAHPSIKVPLLISSN